MSKKEAEALAELKKLIKAPGIDSKALESPRMAKLRDLIEKHSEANLGPQNPKMVAALEELRGTLDSSLSASVEG